MNIEAEMDAWFIKALRHKDGLGPHPGKPPIDGDTAVMMGAWLEISVCLESLPEPWIDDIVSDEIDPDDRALYYRSEGETRRFANLGEIRKMARIVRAVRVLRQKISEMKPANQH